MDDTDININGDALESQAFYELMQTYRHASAADQAKVAEAFEAVKRFIRLELER